MEFISHRINTKADLKLTPNEYGVELDLRDASDNSLHLSHDPFIKGEDFKEYLKEYNHQTIILNVKSERIEHRVLELIKEYHVEKYFFLDSSFPMIKLLTDLGERNIAIRFSEFEGLDTIETMQGKVDWVWVDCFTKLPMKREIFLKLKEWGYKLCLVSPELQGQEEKISVYAQQINNEKIEFDAICCKERNIKVWKEMLNII